MKTLDQDQLHFVLESAILAPSADNQHRFRFEITDDGLRIRYTEAELPPEGGYKRVLALLSLGAVAENLAIAASRFGIGTQTVLLPDPAQPDLIMQIRLQPGQAAVDSLWEAIPLRHTNRQVRFHGPSMTAAERGELEAAAHIYPTSQLHWLDQPARRRQALRLMRRAETERFHNRLLHAELFSAIRFDVGWRTSCPEGLPPGALGVEPLLRPFFSQLRHWPVMHLANLVGAHYILGWRACALPCRLAPNLGLLAVKNTDTVTILAAGRAFQRLWLRATQQGQVLQPMPASALYALPGACEEGIPADLRQILATGWQTILPGEIPLMLFRMGHAQVPAVTPGRRALADYWRAAS